MILQSQSNVKKIIGRICHKIAFLIYGKPFFFCEPCIPQAYTKLCLSNADLQNKAETPEINYNVLLLTPADRA